MYYMVANQTYFLCLTKNVKKLSAMDENFMEGDQILNVSLNTIHQSI
jgi:hypothetical protein